MGRVELSDTGVRQACGATCGSSPGGSFVRRRFVRRLVAAPIAAILFGASGLRALGGRSSGGEGWRDARSAPAAGRRAQGTPEGSPSSDAPEPDWLNDVAYLIPDAKTRAWNDLGPRSIKGVVYHRLFSGLADSDAYLRSVPEEGLDFCDEDPNSPDYFRWGGCRGLFDFGVDNVTGEIRRWNDPLGRADPDRGVSANRAPWASGPVQDPSGSGLAFLSVVGGDFNAVNRDLVSVGVAGQGSDPIEEPCLDAIAEITAYFAGAFGVSAGDYPNVPGLSYGFVLLHSDFCTCRATCPGPIVLEALPDIIERTRARLPEPPPATPSP